MSLSRTELLQAWNCTEGKAIDILIRPLPAGVTSNEDSHAQNQSFPEMFDSDLESAPLDSQSVPDDGEHFPASPDSPPPPAPTPSQIKPRAPEIDKSGTKNNARATSTSTQNKTAAAKAPPQAKSQNPPTNKRGDNREQKGKTGKARAAEKLQKGPEPIAAAGVTGNPAVNLAQFRILPRHKSEAAAAANDLSKKGPTRPQV